jgi:hypothetical protein
MTLGAMYHEASPFLWLILAPAFAGLLLEWAIRGYAAWRGKK